MIDRIIPPFAGGDELAVEAENSGKFLSREGDGFPFRPRPILVQRDRHDGWKFSPCRRKGQAVCPWTRRDQLPVNHGFAAIRPFSRSIPQAPSGEVGQAGGGGGTPGC